MILCAHVIDLISLELGGEKSTLFFVYGDLRYHKKNQQVDGLRKHS